MDNSPLTALIIAVLCVLPLASSCNKTDTKAVSSSAPSEAPQSTQAPFEASQNTPAPLSDGVTAAPTGNLPRITTLKLSPLAPRKSDELAVQASADVEGVEFSYQWSINGNLLNMETGPTLKNVFRKGDRVSVVITPEADGVSGFPLMQAVVIGNSPPVVKSEFADVTVKGNSYSCRVQAEDPDGDPLVYTLLKGPQSVTIDRNTGVITGEYQQADEGMHSLSISVKDVDNAEANVTIQFRMSFGK